MHITRMQVNHITNPLGFGLGERPPSVGWLKAPSGRVPRLRAWS